MVNEWIEKNNHIWKKDENGEIDEFAFEVGYHNGVVCEKCGDCFCMHCDPDYDEERCDVIHYECPICKNESLQKTEFCSKCGAMFKEDK